MKAAHEAMREMIHFSRLVVKGKKATSNEKEGRAKFDKLLKPSLVLCARDDTDGAGGDILANSEGIWLHTQSRNQ